MPVHARIVAIMSDMPHDLTFKDRMAYLMERQKTEQGFVAKHALRVAATAHEMAVEMCLNDTTAHDIYLSGCWHDIGKLAIPNDILEKPGALSKDEYEIVQLHTDAGMMLIGESTKQIIKDVVLFHHERYDGHGYRGLKGEEIPIAARIMAIADVHTALTEERAYKDALSEEETLLLMTKDVESPAFGRRSFDPDLLRFFVSMRLTDPAVKISYEAKAELKKFAESQPSRKRLAEKIGQTSQPPPNPLLDMQVG